MQIEDLRIDVERYEVSLDGEPLELTYKEFELLKFLATHPGRVYSRDQLLNQVWGIDFIGGSRTVDVHIRRLRAKLGPKYAVLVDTVRNVGYKFLEEL
ncbi:MAG: winged helix-turn-helix transcriptional regulator [Candidatus Omnitrophica bacterium]|nr:winged helix-turn-helix transcriptional regulator [Candidatus Omnitrophota bacterium]